MDTQNLINNLSNGILLLMVCGIPVFAQFQKVAIFDSFLEGAKNGIQVIIKIIPYFVGMMVAIGMLRASGAFQTIGHWLGPVLSKIGMPIDLLPLALIRPFSGAGANGILADVIHANGGNAFVSHLGATMMGSTETTFYVIAVYFGVANIRKTRHAIPVGLFADAVGIFAAIFICHWLL